MTRDHRTTQGHEASRRSQIIDFLKYYCDREKTFDFAVMLGGPWGVGKTHLIKSFLDGWAADQGIKSVLVSLYGKTQVSQIEEEIFRQLHPLLGSKTVKVLGSVAKGLIKVGTKFTLAGADVSVDPSMPSLNLSELFPTPKDCLLVFDDLERTPMKIQEVIGYINSFVEHEGIKVIIIANEEEITKKSEY